MDPRNTLFEWNVMLINMGLFQATDEKNSLSQEITQAEIYEYMY